MHRSQKAKPESNRGRKKKKKKKKTKKKTKKQVPPDDFLDMIFG
jgi:hypothetical protein